MRPSAPNTRLARRNGCFVYFDAGAARLMKGEKIEMSGGG